MERRQQTLANARTHLENGDPSGAIVSLADYLKSQPEDAEALCLLGTAYHAKGLVDDAIRCMNAALRILPEHTDIHVSLGTLHWAKGDAALASDCLLAALRLDERRADAWSALGVILATQNRFEEAVSCHLNAIRISPEHVPAHLQLGNAYFAMGKLEDSVSACREALRRNPSHAAALNTLGGALGGLDRIEEANRCFEQALAITPNYSDAYNNWGDALRRSGHIHQAIPLFHRAIECNPQSAEAHGNLALARLLLGNFEEGFADYEWRWRGRMAMPKHGVPLWDGRPSAEGTLLVHCEQGLGDSLQFIRYVSTVRGRVGRLIVQCQKPLLPLLSRCRDIDELVSDESPLPRFDWHIPLLSLPRVLGTTLSTVPADVPYLFPDPARVARAKRLLVSSGGANGDASGVLNVGIAWQGNPKYRGDRHRSVPLRAFEPLTKVAGVKLYSLQHGFGAEQLAGVPAFGIVDLAPFLEEGKEAAFVDTAAALVSLDLLITSDTAIAHLAGGLGVPVWVAISTVPDWRWLLEGEASPWYPSMRLFRQEERGAWVAVFHRMAGELSARGKRRQGRDQMAKEAGRYDGI